MGGWICVCVDGCGWVVWACERCRFVISVLVVWVNGWCGHICICATWMIWVCELYAYVIGDGCLVCVRNVSGVGTLICIWMRVCICW